MIFLLGGKNKKDQIFKTLEISLKRAARLENSSILIDENQLLNSEKNSQIKRDVENAVENNTVELFLQPIINTKNGKLIGAEALARIRNEKGELIPPVDFIPIAEKNGRINQLGEQMFEKTCRFISENDIEAMGLSWINVNLSPIQFLRKDLSIRFNKIIEKYNLDAKNIHLEITEESMIDYQTLHKQINTMKDSGFQFVLDDYGKGYSNVSRLKRCPFINIKLDMELVWDYFNDQDQILPTLVNTFKLMNFTVTAEGIETEEMADAMKNIGCDFLQGYCFSKPLPVDEFILKYGKQKA